MAWNAVEVETCSVVVTPASVVLIVRTAQCHSYQITFPPDVGKAVAEEISLGWQAAGDDSKLN